MRYLPLTPDDRREMLATIGAGSVRDLFKDVPAKVWQSKPVDLPAHQGELEVDRATNHIGDRDYEDLVAEERARAAAAIKALDEEGA